MGVVIARLKVKGRPVVGVRRSGSEIHMWLPRGWELPVVDLDEEFVTVETEDCSRFHLPRTWFKLSGEFESRQAPGRPTASAAHL